MSGPLAQLVEQLTLNQEVVGSIPTRPTSKFKHLALFELGAFLFGTTLVLPFTIRMFVNNFSFYQLLLR